MAAKFETLFPFGENVFILYRQRFSGHAVFPENLKIDAGAFFQAVPGRVDLHKRLILSLIHI